MTATQSNSKLIDGIFGSGSAIFDISKNTQNTIIGALNSPTVYGKFSANFTARLKRLEAIYSTQPDYLKVELSSYEETNNLFGIIFLEDNAILSENPNETNVKSFAYLNLNAVRPLTQSLSSEFITGLHNY